MIGLRNLGRHADVTPAGEVPGVGEVAALLGFDRLDPAVLPVEKDAGAVRLVDEGKATAVGAEPGVALDKVILLKAQMVRDGRDFCCRDFHVARPAAAVGTALAKVFRGLFHEMEIKMRLKMKVGAGT